MRDRTAFFFFFFGKNRPYALRSFSIVRLIAGQLLPLPSLPTEFTQIYYCIGNIKRKIQLGAARYQRCPREKDLCRRHLNRAVALDRLANFVGFRGRLVAGVLVTR